MLTMLPLRFASSGAAARVSRKMERRLMSIMRSHSETGVASAVPGPSTPAPFTTPSSPPKRSTAARTHAATGGAAAVAAHLHVTHSQGRGMPRAELDGAVFAAAIWGLAAAALLALLPGWSPRGRLSLAASAAVARLLAALSSLALAFVGALGLAGLPPRPLRWWPGLPGDPFTLGVDALTAPFLLLLGVLAAASFAAQPVPAPGARG